MQRSQLEHLIRAAAEITNQYEFVVIGSQSIVGAIDSPPAECTVSMEADIYPLQAPELADLIDGSIGELSFSPSTSAVTPKASRQKPRTCRMAGKAGWSGCKQRRRTTGLHIA